MEVLIREQRRFLRPRFLFARVAAVAVLSRAAHRHRDGVPERDDEAERGIFISRLGGRSAVETPMFFVFLSVFLLVEY